MIDDLERARRLPQKPPCAASKGASWYLFFLFYFFFDICLRPAAPSACRGGDLSVSACPRGLGAVWPFGRVLPHGRLALLVRLAAGRRQGGLRAVVLCGGGATWAGRSCLACVAPHSLYYLCSTPACDQAPLLYLIYFLFCFTQIRNGHPLCLCRAFVCAKIVGVTVRSTQQERIRKQNRAHFPRASGLATRHTPGS